MAKLSDKPLARLESLVGLDAVGNVRRMPHIGTAESIAGTVVPPDIASFVTSGYHQPGDGGSAQYVRTNDEVWHLASADGARWRVSELYPNVRMFGARGDGSDDTAAIEAAHAYSNHDLAALPVKASLVQARKPVIYPPGHYVYSGRGVVQDGGQVVMIGSPNGSLIEVKSDVYFLTIDGRVESTSVSNMHFKGGKGAFRYTWTKNNVAGIQSFENCKFFDYSECAIGNNSSDHPYLKVRSCMFFGSRTGKPIGIAWGGYLDSMTIEDCSFMLNRYHMKLGPRISGSVNISKNDFIMFGKNIRKADIWIVPSRAWVNSGSGFIIERNKFGNENMSPDDARILIAGEDEASGEDRLSRGHSEAWIRGKAFARGIVLDRNRIDALSGMRAPFIRSFIPNVDVLECTDNYFGGGVHTYLCEFMAPPETTRSGKPAGPDSPRWNVALNGYSTAFSRDISNRPVGVTIDPFQVMPAIASNLASPSGGDDAGYVPLLEDGEPVGVGSCSIRPLGGRSARENRAREILIEGDPDKAFARVPLGEADVGRASWIEFDIAASAGPRVRSLMIEIRHEGTGALALRNRIVPPSIWRTIRIPFVFPDAADMDRWQLLLKPRGYVEGSAGGLMIGRIRVYHAAQPMNSGHLRTLGSGRWNEEHIVLGGHHLWIDASGRMRIKAGMPASDEDGKPVGVG